MAVIDGYKKVKNYILTSKGYQLLSRWTHASTVECEDGKTVQTKVGAIDGITDSLNSTSSTTALSAKAGNQLNSDLSALNQSMNAKLDWDIIFSGAIASDGYKWFKFNNYTEVYVVVLDANDYYHPFIIPINQFTSEARNFSDGAVTIRGITGAIALITGKSMAVCAR